MYWYRSSTYSTRNKYVHEKPLGKFSFSTKWYGPTHLVLLDSKNITVGMATSTGQLLMSRTSPWRNLGFWCQAKLDELAQWYQICNGQKKLYTSQDMSTIFSLGYWPAHIGPSSSLIVVYLEKNQNHTYTPISLFRNFKASFSKLEKNFLREKLHQ